MDHLFVRGNCDTSLEHLTTLFNLVNQSRLPLANICFQIAGAYANIFNLPVSKLRREPATANRNKQQSPLRRDAAWLNFHRHQLQVHRFFSWILTQSSSAEYRLKRKEEEGRGRRGKTTTSPGGQTRTDEWPRGTGGWGSKMASGRVPWYRLTAGYKIWRYSSGH